MADAATPEERVAASGVTGDSDADRRAAYAAYLAMLGSGTVQLAVKVAHEYLNKHSLVVSSGPGRRAVPDLRRPHPAARARRERSPRRGRPRCPGARSPTCCGTGRRAVDSWDIFDSFPDHVEQDGRMISLPEWHRGGLRDLCFELFGRRSTRAVRFVMSSAFRQLGTPVG